MRLTQCDIDTRSDYGATFERSALSRKSSAAPLYYAALRGFHNLIEHLIIKHPQDVDAGGGYYVRPLVAALAGKHFQTIDLLRHNSADPDVRGQNGRKSLQAAAFWEFRGGPDTTRVQYRLYQC